MDNEVLATPSQDSKNIALLVWIGTIFLCFIPSLIVYLVQKDDAYVRDQAKEALNWSITAVFGYLAGTILYVILIGFLVNVAVWLVGAVFGIMGAMATSKGENFRVPFAIRLIK